MSHTTFHNPLYSLGCPVWNCDSWKGKVYGARAKREVWLKQYSELFNTVEGNSTFYGLPTLDTVRSWGQRATAGFQFCLKFPRTITHDSLLRGAELELHAFLERLEILASANVLGPSLLQLPPSFATEQYSDLERFLQALPSEFSYAVEVRHLDWFSQENSSRLNDLLSRLSIDRVIFDSRPLYSKPASDPTERESQNRKPKLPVDFHATGQRPMMRLIGRNKIEEVHPWIEPWSKQIGNWINEGLRPIVFTHTPDDANAPDLARLLHDSLCEKLSQLQPVTAWPFETPIQRELF